MDLSLPDDEADWVTLDGARKGDDGAFARLYQRHHRPLYRFALLRSGSRAVAEDVLQDIFLGLLTGDFAYNPARGTLQKFLLGVARNLVLRREGQGSRQFVAIEAEDEEDALIDPAPGPEAKLLTAARAEAVRLALGRLPPHQRDVVILYEMHDLSYLEIASLCGIDVGTVRSRLSRARARLASLLIDVEAVGAAAGPTDFHARKVAP